MPEMLGVPWIKLCKTQVSAVCGVDRGLSERVRDRCCPRGGLAANGTGSRIQAPVGHLRSVTLPTYWCGVSVNTRMALGDNDVGSDRTL